MRKKKHFVSGDQVFAEIFISFFTQNTCMNINNHYFLMNPLKHSQVYVTEEFYEEINGAYKLKHHD